MILKKFHYMDRIKDWLINNWKIVSLIIFSTIFIIGSVFCILIFSSNINSWYNLESPYKFGGILSGVFAGLAFLGVLISLILQITDSKRLKKTNEIQRFENTFFQMMNLQQEIVKGLSLKYNHIKINDKGESKHDEDWVEGRECFQTLFVEGTIGIPKEGEALEVFKDLSKSPIHSDKLYEGQSNQGATIFIFGGMTSVINLFGKSGYEKSCELPLFDHYFRHLYRIIKFIDESVFLDDNSLKIVNRYKYACLVRAVLSPYELAWIYYNCLSNYGNEKFKVLIEKYTLLKNIRHDLLPYSKKYNEEVENQKEIFENEGYPLNDYEFYLNVDENQKSKDKYYLSAFKNSIELPIWNKYYNLLITGTKRTEAQKVLDEN